MRHLYGRLRQECLDQHWFASLDDARTIIEAWRVEGQYRPSTYCVAAPSTGHVQGCLASGAARWLTVKVDQLLGLAQLAEDSHAHYTGSRGAGQGARRVAIRHVTVMYIVYPHSCTASRYEVLWARR